MFREWLPGLADFSDALKAAKALPQDVQVTALRRLANHNIDFANSVKLDRELRKSIGAGSSVEGLLPIRLAILSTSTTVHLPPAIRVACLGRGMIAEIYEPDYGQFQQEMSDPASGLSVFGANAILFAHDPYSLFGNDDNGATIDARVDRKVDEIRAQWAGIRQTSSAVILQQVPFNPIPRLAGENERRLSASKYALIRVFQDRIISAADQDGVDIVDLDHWASKTGLSTWHSSSLWHRSKQEVHPVATPLYGDLVARVLAARFGKSAKCLVLDLDNTLWSGVIGDDGLEGRRLIASFWPTNF